MTVSLTKLKAWAEASITGYLDPERSLGPRQPVDYYDSATGEVHPFADTPLRYATISARACGSVPANEALALAEQAAAGRKQGVIGYDITFSAPKSVSLAMVLAGEDVLAAHDRAVDEALRLVGTVFTRHGWGGKVFAEADATIVTARHHTSRNLDPQLHTHALLLNAARVPGSEAPQTITTDVYHLQSALNRAYLEGLRRELAKVGIKAQLVETEEKDERTGKPFKALDLRIDEISAEACEYFSSRRHEIEKAGLAGLDTAAVMTRQGKKKVISLERLAQLWRETLEKTFGISLQRHEPAHLSLPPVDLDLVVRQSLEAAEQRAGTAAVKRADAITALVEQLAQLPPEYDFTATLDDALKRLEESTIAIGGVPPRIVSASILEAERRTLENAERFASRRFSAPIRDELLQGLTDEQRKAAEVAAGNGFSVISGAAGTGKTRSLAALVSHLHETEEGEVWGLALAARTAAALREAGVDQTKTIHGAILALERKEAAVPATIVIDEAAMVDTRLLDKLLTLADEKGVQRVVLAGDTAQLQAIGAGGMFEELRKRAPNAEITRVFRQQDEADRLALMSYRAAILERSEKAHDHALKLLKAKEATGIKDAVEHAAKAALAGKLVIAPSRRLVREIGERAEQLAGVKHEFRMMFYDEKEAGVGVGSRLLLKQGVYFGYGPNATQLFNGDRLEVTGITAEAVRFRVERLGREVILSREEFEALRLAHGYAMTVHASQGATAEEAVFVTDRPVSHEMLYVALSRHKKDIEVVFADGDTAESVAEGAQFSEAQLGSKTIAQQQQVGAREEEAEA